MLSTGPTPLHPLKLCSPGWGASHCYRRAIIAGVESKAGCEHDILPSRPRHLRVHNDIDAGFINIGVFSEMVDTW